MLFSRKQVLLELRRTDTFHILHQGVVNSQCFHRESFQIRSLAMESKMRSLNHSVIDYFTKLQ